jgi:mono/diheme cytochrome c family protein
MAKASTRRRTIELAVVVLLGRLWAGSGAPAQSGVAGSGARAAPDIRVVEAYRNLCLECHDSDGKGAIARDVLPRIPDFTAAAWQASRTDAELARSILDGKGKSMPKMRAKLGPLDVGRVVVFVRGFRDGKQVVPETPETPAPSEPAAAPGAVARNAPPSAGAGDDARLFQRFCAKCHGSDGRGAIMRDSLPRIPDFSNPRWQTAHSDAQLVVSVLDGKGTEMPAFRGKLAREQARAVVAAVRRFSSAGSRPDVAAPSDFESQFRALVAEFERLREQSRALEARGRAADGRP